MLYHLTEWLNDMGMKFPGSALFGFITSRVLLAVILSLVISAVFGKRLINYLLKKQVGETVRDLGLEGGTPKVRYSNMGGFIIILAHIGSHSFARRFE
jgi:phospho-N-acetylmuramoyl-pentapeptide-transferase